MSTDYLTRQPMMLRQAIAKGFTYWQSEEGQGLHDGTNYVHVDQMEGIDGQVYLSVTRFGLNDATRFEEELGLVSEYEEDYMAHPVYKRWEQDGLSSSTEH